MLDLICAHKAGVAEGAMDQFSPFSAEQEDSFPSDEWYFTFSVWVIRTNKTQ